MYKEFAKKTLNSGGCKASYVSPPCNFLGVHLDREFISDAYLFVSTQILRKVWWVQNLWNKAYKVAILFDGLSKLGVGLLNAACAGSYVETGFCHDASQ